MGIESILDNMRIIEKNTIERCLNLFASHSGIGYHVVNNLKCETRLPINILKEILIIFLNGNNILLLKNAYIDKCRSNILKGGNIPTPWPSFLGRAVTPRRFYQLMVELGYFSSEIQAKKFFQNLLSKPTHIVRKRLQDKYLGKYLMWATFNPLDLSGDPFFFDAYGCR